MRLNSLIVRKEIWWRSHSVHPSPPFYKGGGELSLQPNFQKGWGLTEPQLFEGGCWERGGDFFQGGCNFYIKYELKSEMFNDKKNFISKNIFLCHN